METNDSFAREPHLELWWIEWAVNHKQKSYPPKRGSTVWFNSRESEDADWVGGVTLREANGWVELTRGVPSSAWEKDNAIEEEWCSRHPWSLVLGLLSWQVLWIFRNISQMALLLLCHSPDVQSQRPVVIMELLLKLISLSLLNICLSSYISHISNSLSPLLFYTSNLESAIDKRLEFPT